MILILVIMMKVMHLVIFYETILKELQSAGSSGEFYTPRAVTDFMAAMINPQVGEVMADFACGNMVGFLISWLNELHKKVKNCS